MALRENTRITNFASRLFDSLCQEFLFAVEFLRNDINSIVNIKTRKSRLKKKSQNKNQHLQGYWNGEKMCVFFSVITWRQITNELCRRKLVNLGVLGFLVEIKIRYVLQWRMV